MKKLLYVIFLVAVWSLGIYEGDCTAAVFLSLLPLFQILEIAVATLKWQIHKRKI